MNENYKTFQKINSFAYIVLGREIDKDLLTKF